MHRSLFLTLGVLALVLAPSLGNQFIYDDLFVFVTTDLVHSLSNVPNFFAHNTMWAAGHLEPLLVDTYRPLTLTTFALDSVVTGRNPLGYHLTNLLLHALNTAMVYAVARRLFSDTNKRHAWIPAAAFSYSPWLGEAHLWINGRSDPLCLALLAGALLTWDRACQNRAVRWQFATGFLFLGALLSKEVALMALPILPLWPPLRKQHKNLRARCALCAAPLAAAGLYLALRGWVLQGLKTHGDLSQLL
ncbi:MAG: glycosyltransferase family 39 protein, partial [Myxococcota bacterium]